MLTPTLKTIREALSAAGYLSARMTSAPPRSGFHLRRTRAAVEVFYFEYQSFWCWDQMKPVDQFHAFNQTVLTLRDYHASLHIAGFRGKVIADGTTLRPYLMLKAAEWGRGIR